VNKDWLGTPPGEGGPAHGGATFADEQQSGGHPLPATLISGFIILFLAAGTPVRHMPTSPAELAGNVAGCALVGAIGWGIAYAITIKHASTAWKTVSLIVLLLAGGFGGIVRLGAPGVAMNDDLRASSNEMERVLESGGDLNVRMKGDGGPLSRITAALANGAMEDASRFERALTEAQVPALLAMDGLTRSSPLFRNCDRMAALEPLAQELGANRERHVAAARQIAEQAIEAGELPRNMLSGFEEGARNTKPRHDRQWALHAELGVESAALCRHMAARPWQLSGGQVTFNSAGDAAAYNARIGRINAIADEQERLLALSQADARRGVDQMRRMAR